MENGFGLIVNHIMILGVDLCSAHFVICVSHIYRQDDLCLSWMPVIMMLVFIHLLIGYSDGDIY